MIKLIRNEYIKNSRVKLFISSIIIILIIYFIIDFNSNRSAKYLISTMYKFIPFISILLCILFGGIVSNEFHSGTIRIYLAKPVKRWKILLSKIILIYIYIVIFIIVTILSYIIMIKIYKGVYIDIKTIKEILVYFIPVFFTGSIIVFLSILTNSTAASVGISILICFTSNLIAQIFFGFGYTIFQYTFLPYIDFSIFKDLNYIKLMSSELNVNLTINNGIIILLTFSLLFIFLSFNIFNKKDINN